MADIDPCINQSSKVRVIAKIRDFTSVESQSFNLGGSIPSPSISVHKTSQRGLCDKYTVSVGNQPTRYEVDYCYQQNEDIELIFSREVQPLIPEVFEGKKASVIAFGARSSGKTYTIQGSEEKHGLATLALAEFFRVAEEKGILVAVSLYDVFQEHVYDLLSPEHTEVQIWEVAPGKIKLEGLSQVKVKSISEFNKLYYMASSSKVRRSHKGLMIHLLSCNGNSNMKLVGKMNFVDLSGYEASRGSSYLSETARINKSLMALQNVIYALTVKEHHVPYRECKIARILQDSLGDTNRILMLTCLNPLFCQDTVYTLSVASRSVIHASNVFPKKSKGSAIPAVNVLAKTKKPLTTLGSMKKLTNSRTVLSEKVVKGRKLFEDRNQSVSCKTPKSRLDSCSAIRPEPASVNEQISSFKEKSQLGTCSAIQTDPASLDKKNSSFNEVNSIPGVTIQTDPTSLNEQTSSLLDVNSLSSITIQNDPASLKEQSSSLEEVVSPHDESGCMEDTLRIYGDTLSKEDEKENNNLITNGDESPPLSVRLKEISDNLRTLCSTPLPSFISPPQNESVCSYILEPKTPIVLQDSRVSDKLGTAKFSGPWQALSARSSGMKHAFDQECLQFFNSASKEELKGFKGIGEKRATYILELREESLEPFKTLDDLREIGLSAKQIKCMMKKAAGDLFS